MSSTNFNGPITIGEKTGNVTTQTYAYVPASMIIEMGVGNSTVTVPMPPDSILTGLAFVHTSAFTGTDAVSAMNVTFTTGTVQMAQFSVSAGTVTKYSRSTNVSGAVFDTSGNVTIAISAVSTTVFTGGGGRAMIEYIKRS